MRGFRMRLPPHPNPLPQVRGDKLSAAGPTDPAFSRNRKPAALAGRVFTLFDAAV